jgi:DNA-directed RNA polymerase subunit RPC12/RpoP
MNKVVTLADRLRLYAHRPSLMISAYLVHAAARLDELERARDELERQLATAVQDTIERCAKICDYDVTCNARNNCATAIRALAPCASGPVCEDCGGELVKGELDRSGQSYWCPECAKQLLRKLKAEREAKEQAEVIITRDLADETRIFLWSIRHPDARRLSRKIDKAMNREKP